jgi:broad specificity phosphatase PhoE
MSEILLIRHAQSYANTRDMAFGNQESPLTPRGIQEAYQIRERLIADYGIVPGEYDVPVLASAYLRPQMTAQYAGFSDVEIDPILNEADLLEGSVDGRQLIEKHATERWAPEALRARARRFIELVRTNTLPHHIFFTHGVFKATVLLELEDDCIARGEQSPYLWDLKRGFVPRLATITPVTVPAVRI